LRDVAGTSWLLSWCGWCKAGFLYASSANYGWECCACVAWDAGLGQYEVWQEFPANAGHKISPQMVAKLPPIVEHNKDAANG
jgi:hypothetical protein